MGEEPFYYETHIVTSGLTERLRDFGFWSSRLTMDTSGEERADDVIWTTRGKSLATAKLRLKEVLDALAYTRTPQQIVKRYKIEACVIDSKRDDTFFPIKG